MYSQTHVLLHLFIDKPTSTRQRRRLVINIGGQIFGSQILVGGSKILGKYIFRPTF